MLAEFEWVLRSTFERALEDHAASGATIANQGRISGADFADALTDDPSTVAASDPTTFVVVSQPDFVTSTKTVAEEDGDGLGGGGGDDVRKMVATMAAPKTPSESTCCAHAGVDAHAPLPPERRAAAAAAAFFVDAGALPFDAGALPPVAFADFTSEGVSCSSLDLPLDDVPAASGVAGGFAALRPPMSSLGANYKSAH